MGKRRHLFCTTAYFSQNLVYMNLCYIIMIQSKKFLDVDMAIF
jgi:hypothetical protein